MTPLNKAAKVKYDALVTLTVALSNAINTGAIETLVDCGYLPSASTAEELLDAAITFVEG